MKLSNPSSSTRQDSTDYICKYLQYLCCLRYSRGNCCQIYYWSFYSL